LFFIDIHIFYFTVTAIRLIVCFTICISRFCKGY